MLYNITKLKEVLLQCVPYLNQKFSKTVKIYVTTAIKHTILSKSVYLLTNTKKNAVNEWKILSQLHVWYVF